MYETDNLLCATCVKWELQTRYLIPPTLSGSSYCITASLTAKEVWQCNRAIHLESGKLEKNHKMTKLGNAKCSCMLKS